jgi:hypothetical protein
MNGWTNYHCHTNIDPDVDLEMTPAYYAGLLGPRLRRAVLLNHGYDYYVLEDRRPMHTRATGSWRSRSPRSASPWRA